MADNDEWRDDDGKGKPSRFERNRGSQPPYFKFLLWVILLSALPIFLWYYSEEKSSGKVVQLGPGEFRTILESKPVVGGDARKILSADVIVEPGIDQVEITGKMKVFDGEKTDERETEVRYRVSSITYDEKLQGLLDKLGKEYKEKKRNTFIPNLLTILAPVVLFVVILYFFFSRQMKSAGRGAMQFGKSRARLAQNLERVTFKDVAGIDNAREEVMEIVEYLRDPGRFHKLGGRIPHGVLLVGPPGTGKTLLARAIAGEADVPFFTISGSDFVEMFVGVGASRVRDMFEQAKRNSPCIIFIDEIDAVGRSRFSGMGGGHDEREQTLNALLVEMDGFEMNSGVIVVAATNRPDVLDKALLRPGRFDRQVNVELPDLVGRKEIIQVHIKKITVVDDIDLDQLARSTPGFSGADIENLINEAALTAARNGKEAVEIDDFEEARDKVMFGKERPWRAMSEKDRKMTACHEAGHALVSIYCNHSDPLHKVSIIPRGKMLGGAMYFPEGDKVSQSRNELFERMVIACGGRCAEQIAFGELNSGAYGDIQQASRIARAMVMRLGMSDRLGFIEYASNNEDMGYLGHLSRPEFSEQTSREIDAEVRRLMDDAMARATELLSEHRDQLDKVTDALLERETLSAEEVYGLLDMPLPERLRDALGTPQKSKVADSGEDTASESKAEPEEESSDSDDLAASGEAVLVEEPKVEPSEEPEAPEESADESQEEEEKEDDVPPLPKPELRGDHPSDEPDEEPAAEPEHG